MDTNRDTHTINPLNGNVSRRTALRGLGGAGFAAALGIAAHSSAAAAESASGAAMIEPEAGSWKTWILSSGDQLRPVPPPDEAATKSELAELQELASKRDAEVLERISYWDAGSPGYRWNEIAMHHTSQAQFGPNSYRVMAHLNAAIYDATVAAWDAKYAFNRSRPATADASLETAISTPASPSYPCEHAVTAGAAATVLAYVFPDDAAALADMAEEVAHSRVEAGVAYPSDAAGGLELGRKVGALFVARAKSDGSDAEFDPTTMPTGPGIWTGDPFFPLMGTWKTWVLKDGSALRPPAPPAWDSAEREAEIDEVKNYKRDAFPATELFFWSQDPAGRPEPDSGPFSSNQIVFYWAPILHYLWGPELAQKLFEYRLDANAPRAARAYALVSIASYEATVACWDAKYTYWTARPYQFDPTIVPILPQYGIPDYPSGHATTLGGTAEVLAYLFPRDAHFFQSRAEENAASRLWAGIHFRSACDVGLKLGREVGQAIIDRAKNDGAD